MMPANYITCTIFLPLVGSVALAVANKLNPAIKWAHLESAATAMESEIYLYRTRVSRYSKMSGERSATQVVEQLTTDKQATEAKEKKKEATETSRRAVFANTIKGILDDALSSDMRYDYLMSPKKGERTALVELYDSKKQMKEENKTRWSCLPSCCTRRRGGGDLQEALLPTVSPEEDHSELWTGTGSDFAFNPESRDGQSAKNDGLAELQPEDYLQIRLIPMLRKYNNQARFLGRMVKTVQVVITFMTGLTTMFAALTQIDLRPCVPIIVAWNALLMQCSEYENYQTRLVNVRKSIEELTNLQVWWQSLSGAEKRKPQSKEKLVTTTEEQNDAEISAWKKSGKKGGDEEDEQQKGGDAN